MRKDVSRLCILGLSRRGLISASAVGIFGQAEAQVATRGTNDLWFNAETISSLPRFGKWEVIVIVSVRSATASDVESCGRIIYEAFKGINENHGFPQDFPSIEAATQLATAYLSAATPWIQNHGVAETEQDMKALILGTGAASAEPLSFLLPVRQSNLFRWCLSEGIRVVKPMTLMAIGHYREPQGTYFPTVSY